MHWTNWLLDISQTNFVSTPLFIGNTTRHIIIARAEKLIKSKTCHLTSWNVKQEHDYDFLEEVMNAKKIRIDFFWQLGCWYEPNFFHNIRRLLLRLGEEENFFALATPIKSDKTTQLYWLFCTKFITAWNVVISSALLGNRDEEISLQIINFHTLHSHIK